MSTTVTGRIVREVGFDTFADLTDAPIVAWPRDGITFDADLDAATVTAIRDRMASRDDVDQADRAMLRDAAAAGAINLAEMHLAYTLGDPIPDPVPPQT